MPELSEGELHEAGDVEAHLAGCAACRLELARYRTVVMELTALRDVLVEPPAGFLGRVLAEVPDRQWRALAKEGAETQAEFGGHTTPGGRPAPPMAPARSTSPAMTRTSAPPSREESSATFWARMSW